MTKLSTKVETRSIADSDGLNCLHRAAGYVQFVCTVTFGTSVSSTESASCLCRQIHCREGTSISNVKTLQVGISGYCDTSGD